MSRRAGTVVAALTSLLLLGALSSAAVAQEPQTEPATSTPGAQAGQSVDSGSEAGSTATPAGEEDIEPLEEKVSPAKEKSGAQAGADEAGTSGEARNCDDFATQEEAQQYFTANGGSDTTNVDNLDRDGDGIACETGEEASAPAGAPTSGPHSGGGTAAPPGDSSPLGFILGGAGIGLVLATMVLMRRRRAVT